jgi:hypothetical protein
MHTIYAPWNQDAQAQLSVVVVATAVPDPGVDELEVGTDVTDEEVTEMLEFDVASASLELLEAGLVAGASAYFVQSYPQSPLYTERTLSYR